MRSKIWLDLNENNNPVIKVKYSMLEEYDDNDLKDKFLHKFLSALEFVEEDAETLPTKLKRPELTLHEGLLHIKWNGTFSPERDYVSEFTITPIAPVGVDRNKRKLDYDFTNYSRHITAVKNKTEFINQTEEKNWKIKTANTLGEKIIDGKSVYEIYVVTSVERISDNKVFQIGDIVGFNTYKHYPDDETTTIHDTNPNAVIVGFYHQAKRNYCVQTKTCRHDSTYTVYVDINSMTKCVGKEIKNLEV